MKIGSNAHASRNAVADGRAAVASQIAVAAAALAELGRVVASAVDSDSITDAEAALRTAHTALGLSCRRLRYTLDRVAAADPVRLAVLAGDQAGVDRAIEAEVVEEAGADESSVEAWNLVFRTWPAFLHTHGLDVEAPSVAHPFGDLARFNSHGRKLRLRRAYERYTWAFLRFWAQSEDARPVDKERADRAQADAAEAFSAWLASNGHRVAAYLGRALDQTQSPVELMDEIATKAKARDMDRWAPRRALARALGDALIADLIIGG